jgi:hypothetical protein
MGQDMVEELGYWENQPSYTILNWSIKYVHASVTWMVRKHKWQESNMYNPSF